ncbi:MAG: MFS transporter [Planctomycetota bacterium]
MSTEQTPAEAVPAAGNADSARQQLFWGCFVALITTSFAFVGRLTLIGTWSEQFGLDPAQAGRLAGIGIWPFAVSIIGFSLFIDRIGYKTAMFVAFLGHLVWAVLGVSAFYTEDKQTAYQMLYWGSLLVALANGTVEAFVNPVVATIFGENKTKWLNILHAGWPGGLVVTGLFVIGLDTYDASSGSVTPWAVKVGIIALPAVIYFLMLVGKSFPQSERVSAGVSYREMLAEFGTAGAAIVGFLTALQLMDFFSGGDTASLSSGLKFLFIGIGVAITVAFGVYTRSFGNPMLLFLCLIMMPLATTEIGTDGWISAIMEGVAEEQGIHAATVLVYTSAIMLVLRFFAGPIVHAISPLGLLSISALLAIAGLTWLSTAEAGMLFAAATLYGVGKTFFWPTMLGVVAEQCPRGGALTLNAISGIGMLAVGTLGFPYIGILQANNQRAAIVEETALEEVPTVEKKSYEILAYQAINDDELAVAVEAAEGVTDEEVAEVRAAANQGALADMAYFPGFMLACYLILWAYFSSTGGYKAQVLTKAEPEASAA